MTFGGCAISTRKIWLVSNGRITRVAYTGWDMRGEFFVFSASVLPPRRTEGAFRRREDSRACILGKEVDNTARLANEWRDGLIESTANVKRA